MPPTRADFLTTYIPTINLAGSNTRRAFKARFVRAGKILNAQRKPTKYIIRPAALEAAVSEGLFENKAVFIDHAGFFENLPWRSQSPSIRNLAGVTQEATYNSIQQSVEGIIKLSNTPAGTVISDLLDELLADGEHAPDIGLSLVFYPTWEGNEITAIQHVESVDLVFQPAADGRILQALSSNVFQSVQSVSKSDDRQPMELITMPETRATYQTNSDPPHPAHLRDETPVGAIGDRPPSPPAAPPSNDMAEWHRLQAIYAARQEDLAIFAARQVIQTSGLPQVSQQRLLDRKYASAQEVEEAIEKERAYLAALTEGNVIHIGATPPRGAAITGMRTGMDQIQLAFEALLAGTRPPDGIQPLTGIREMYNLLSGDYELTGLFRGERVYLANVNSSTMANLVANALNKIVVNEFQEYPRWWEPIVLAQDYNSLQAIKWISLGGIGELPTVAEGAAYTELTWDDNYETASFIKKGGYLGITLETIDKDDTGRVRQAPRALAQAAWLTLSKAISAIFTSASGAGPTLTDSKALFHTDHGNLGTTALSVSELNVVRTAMRKQTELNSSERLGALTAPKFLLVPPDLEMTALQVLASEYQYTYALSNAPTGPANIFSEGSTHDARLAFARSRVIVVDLWTDTNNWAAVADPRLYPTIGLGFRYGRTPEIFSVASPLAGLMFTNDTMPVKVRFIYATGPMDYRGMYKENVA